MCVGVWRNRVNLNHKRRELNATNNDDRSWDKRTRSYWTHAEEIWLTTPTSASRNYVWFGPSSGIQDEPNIKYYAHSKVTIGTTDEESPHIVVRSNSKMSQPRCVARLKKCDYRYNWNTTFTIEKLTHRYGSGFKTVSEKVHSRI